MRLSPEGSGTRLSYSAKATVGGKLAHRLPADRWCGEEDVRRFLHQVQSDAVACACGGCCARGGPHAATAAHSTGTWFWVIAAGAVVALFGIYSMITH